MARVSVYLPDELLDEINEQAKREGTNRSALIQAALEKYIEGKRCEQEEERRRKMRGACCRMEILARKLRNWDPQATIRKFRNGNFKRTVITIGRAILDS
jgi:Arc/MetJ-type ribon-helix-helix transcriptional regulator